MAEYIEREKLLQDISECVVFTVRKGTPLPNAEMRGANKVIDRVKSAPTADVVKVVRCKDCKHAVELDKHCDISRTAYRHCSLLRGDETKYVWHKYKKYYKDYSIVEPDDFCSCGELKELNNNA